MTKHDLHPIDRQIALIYFDPDKRSKHHFDQLKSLIAQGRQCSPSPPAWAATLRTKAGFLISA